MPDSEKDLEKDFDSLSALVERLTKIQEKYTYFILAVCISSIAYTVELTKNLKPSLTMIPLAFAVLNWILSFLCGCWFILNMMNAIRANMQVFNHDVNIGKHWFKKYSQKGKQNFKWQFRFLMLGVLCFILWRIFILFSINPT